MKPGQYPHHELCDLGIEDSAIVGFLLKTPALGEYYVVVGTACCWNTRHNVYPVPTMDTAPHEPDMDELDKRYRLTPTWRYPMDYAIFVRTINDPESRIFVCGLTLMLPDVHGVFWPSNELQQLLIQGVKSVKAAEELL